jgi:membrane protease YdiL (CAAX protease family)
MMAGNTATLSPKSSDPKNSDPTRSAPKHFIAEDRQRRDRLELGCGYALILVVLWTPRPWQRYFYFVAAAFIATALWNSFEGWRAIGLRPTNPVRSFWLVGAALLAAATAVLVAHSMHTLHSPGGPLQFVQRYSGYVLFACVQQGLLQDFFLPRFLRLTRRPGTAAFAAAAIFSLAHLPNPILTVATFVWGSLACLYFLRYRNLYALAIAHGILGVTLGITIPGPTIHNMRVGLGYLTYSRDVHHRSH